MRETVLSEIDQEIDASRDALLSLCRILVQADSTNPPGRTAGVAGNVAAWLEAAGVPHDIIKADEEAPNVVSTVVGGAPGKHVVFNAHMDTMDAGDPTLWSVPPMALTRQDRRVYGLGMGNMKGALAAMCVATALIYRRRKVIGGRLSLTAVSDEVMFGDRGTVFLLNQHPDLVGDYLISGEGPGFMDLAVAEKGLLWLDVEVKGLGGHASAARRGATAAAVLSELLVSADRLNDLYSDVPAELPDVSGGTDHLGFRLSVNAGSLAAGRVRSLIATNAMAQLDLRLPPGISADAAQQMIWRCVPTGANVQIQRVRGWDANWTSPDSKISQAVLEAAYAVRGARPRLVVRLPGSDARRWRDLGVPAVCYGPQPTLSSGVDDYANEQDLLDCAKVYARAALMLMNE
jgi:succinyl-diaminopimelate desuccinylase